jgi:hypothetical protein
VLASWLQVSCGYCPAFRINLGPISLESQLSYAILIHNFLLHLARCQDSHSLTIRLKGGKIKRGWRMMEEGRELRMSYLQKVSLIPSIHRIRMASFRSNGILCTLSEMTQWRRMWHIWEETFPSDMGIRTSTWVRKMIVFRFFEPFLNVRPCAHDFKGNIF